jgi:drug/metabolite transporter (DMT)-like permease
MRGDPRHSAKLVACLAIVYVVWGSTFLFTKIAVTHLPIALYSAVRFLTAGTLLATVARVGMREAWPRILHGVRQQRLERVGDSVSTDQ